MNPSSFYDQIGEYLQDELTPAARAAFEEAMAENPELRREVALERAMQQTLREKDVRDFRASVRQAMDAQKEEAVRKPGLSPVYLAVRLAASLLVVVAAVWWWQSSQKESSIEQLTSAYLVQFDPEVDSLDLGFNRDRDTISAQITTKMEQVAPEWEKLRTLYASGDYRAALEQLQVLKGMDPAFLLFSESEWTYYQGMCQLHLGEPQKALATLEQVKSPFQEKATFFKAIALLKLDRKEEAKSVLASITSLDSHSFKEPAIELSKKLQ